MTLQVGKKLEQIPAMRYCCPDSLNNGNTGLLTHHVGASPDILGSGLQSFALSSPVRATCKSYYLTLNLRSAA